MKVMTYMLSYCELVAFTTKVILKTKWLIEYLEKLFHQTKN